MPKKETATLKEWLEQRREEDSFIRKKYSINKDKKNNKREHK